MSGGTPHKGKIFSAGHIKEKRRKKPIQAKKGKGSLRAPQKSPTNSYYGYASEPANGARSFKTWGGTRGGGKPGEQ